MKRSGFTLIEIMLTLSIIVVLGVVGFLNLQGGSNVTTLTDATKQMATLLRQAQSDSMAQEQGATWGMYFDNTNPNTPFYTLFYTTNASYASSTQVGGQYVLPSKICYATSSIATGASTTIIFNPISGGCNMATSTGVTGSVSRSASGKIFFDNFTRTNL